MRQEVWFRARLGVFLLLARRARSHARSGRRPPPAGSPAASAVPRRVLLACRQPAVHRPLSAPCGTSPDERAATSVNSTQGGGAIPFQFQDGVWPRCVAREGPVLGQGVWPFVSAVPQCRALPSAEAADSGRGGLRWRTGVSSARAGSGTRTRHLHVEVQRELGTERAERRATVEPCGQVWRAMQASSALPARYPFRRHVQDVIDSKIFSAAMLTIIFVNTFLIALQTDQVAQMKAGVCTARRPTHAVVHMPGDPLPLFLTTQPTHSALNCCCRCKTRETTETSGIQTGTSASWTMCFWASTSLSSS